MIKRQILVISSDQTFYGPIQSEMENDTTEIQCVASLSEALNYITSAEYCLILIDMQVSDMDKIEMIRILRITRHLPIIAVSAPLESNEIITLYHAGITSFVEKPMDIEICAAQADALIRLYLQTEEESKSRATVALGSSFLISPYHRLV